MAEGQDDLVRIDATGVARPVGETAAVRLQAREGRFHVLPAPPHLVVMRQVAGEEGRTCILSGEVRSPGVLCDVVSFIGHSTYRGEFIVFDHSASRSLFFDQGHVIAATSTEPKERIGEVLYRYGI